MVSTERFTWALVLASIPVVIGVFLTPPDMYARAIVGLGILFAAFPAAYLVAGLR